MRRFLAALVAFACSLPAAGQGIVVRTAAQDNNTLKYDFQHPRKPGICVEVMRAVEALVPGLSFEGLDKARSLQRIESELAEGQIDVFCALIKTPARAARFQFIDVPVYTVRHKIAVRADDAIDVRNLDEIRKLGANGVIIVSRGTAHEELLRAEPGLLLDASTREINVNLKKLLHQRGRFFYHTENALRHYIEGEGLEGKIRLLPTVFKEDGLYFAASRALHPATAAQLKSALAKLAERGQLQKIYTSYRED
ncbi:MAG: transporter substrate-binding domain-containing protein [Pseudomonadota bacterium]